jgi:hypothetical protein
MRRYESLLSIMQISVDVPDDLAVRLSSLQGQLPQILELGLREWNADANSGFAGLAEVLEFLANLPSPEEVLALQPSQSLTSPCILNKLSTWSLLLSYSHPLPLASSISAAPSHVN